MAGRIIRTEVDMKAPSRSDHLGKEFGPWEIN
jgi:hypothetical protein